MKIYVLAMMVAWFGIASAQQQGDFGSVSHKTLSVEHVYLLKIVTYNLSVGVTAGERMREGTCAKESAEDTVRAYFEALRQVDVARSKDCWTRGSIVEMEQRDRERSRDDSYWGDRWRKTYAMGFDLAITKRGEYGKYVFIEYRVTDNLPAKNVAKDSFALEKVEGKWRLTQALAADPILQYWNSDQSRVQVTPSSWSPLLK
jgi:hypothetical protein